MLYKSPEERERTLEVFKEEGASELGPEREEILRWVRRKDIPRKRATQGKTFHARKAFPAGRECAWHVGTSRNARRCAPGTRGRVAENQLDRHLNRVPLSDSSPGSLGSGRWPWHLLSGPVPHRQTWRTGPVSSKVLWKVQVCPGNGEWTTGSVITI